MILALFFLLTSFARAAEFDSVLVDSSLNLVYGTPSRACYVDSLGNVQTSSVTSTELGYLSGVTSALQTQLNGKQASGSYEPSISSGLTGQYWRGDKTFQTLDTLAVPENTNLYWTQGRFDTAFALKSTADLTELTNLYYTAARVQTLAKNNTGSQVFYVTKDNGNDANDCSLLAPCKTIQAGINAASAVSAYFKQTIVHVAPTFGGTGSEYVENVTFSQQGVNLICDNPQVNARACFISGTVTVNLTGTSGAQYNAAANEVYMNGFVVSATSTANDLVFSGSTLQKFISINNYFDQNGSASAAVISNTGVGSQVSSFDTVYSNSNATNPTVSITSAARFWMYGTISSIANGNASGPSVTQSGVGSSAIYNLVQLTGQYNLSDNTSTASFNLSTITSGTNPCIVTPSSPSTGYALISSWGCNSSNTNSLTGTGVVVDGPGNARFGSSGDIIPTITQAVLGPGFPQGEMMLGAGAVSGTHVLLSVKDGHLKLAQTTAPTTTLSGNAGSGGTPACTITNGTDSAGKISLKTGTASWATGTQCSIVFNQSWGVAPICTFSPSNDAASTAMASQRIVFPDASTSAQTISAGVAFASQVTATWHYHCVETQ